HLEGVEARAELDQRVDAPDEGHREVEQKADREIGEDDARAHGRFFASHSRARAAMSRCSTSAARFSRRMSAAESFPASSASARTTSACRVTRSLRIPGAAAYGVK